MNHDEESTSLIPLRPNVTDLAPVHREFQEQVFSERREAALCELRMASGLPGLARELKPDKVYRLIVPEGQVLQQGSDGLFTGVLRNADGTIAEHAKFEKVPPSLSRIASAVGSQILLVSIAMQLNRIEKAVSALSEELHDDRKAKVVSGIELYERAACMSNPQRRQEAIGHAIQTLTEGLVAVRLELKRRIQQLPSATNSFWDNWGTRKSAQAEKGLRLAEDCFRTSLKGTSVLSQCYAALDEPEAGINAMNQCLEEIRRCGIQEAAQRARIVEVKDEKYLPEAPWLRFDALTESMAREVPVFSLAAYRDVPSSIQIEITKTETAEV